jgi:hypothetical protein
MQEKRISRSVGISEYAFADLEESVEIARSASCAYQQCKI